MIAVATTAAAAVVLATSLLSTTGAGDPCKGVVDSTSTCASPRSVDGAITADAKPAPPPAVFDSSKLSGEFGFVAVALALGGGASFVVAYANNPRTDEEVNVRTVEQIGGISLLVSSVLVASASASLAMFDPATGEFRLKELLEGSD